MASGVSDDWGITLPFFYMASATCFLVWVDGQAAGGGVVTVRQGLASLFSASTRPAFRQRGV